MYEFDIDDSTACLRIDDGRVSVTPGKSPTPSDVTVRASAPTIAALVGRKVTLTDAIAQGSLAVTGDGVAITALLGVIEKRLGEGALA